MLQYLLCLLVLLGLVMHDFHYVGTVSLLEHVNCVRNSTLSLLINSGEQTRFLPQALFLISTSQTGVLNLILYNSYTNLNNTQAPCRAKSPYISRRNLGYSWRTRRFQQYYSLRNWWLSLVTIQFNLSIGHFYMTIFYVQSFLNWEVTKVPHKLPLVKVTYLQWLYCDTTVSNLRGRTWQFSFVLWLKPLLRARVWRLELHEAL